MATVAMRKMSVPYLTAAAGPTSHSPPPIDVAAMTAPAPMILKRFRAPNGGGARRSERAPRHGRARADDLEEVSRPEWRRRRQVGDVPRRQLSVGQRQRSIRRGTSSG